MKEALLTLMKTEWADLHHSRMQEWSALGVVTGAHIVVAQMHKLFGGTSVTIPPSVIALVGYFFGLFVTIIGALVTCRHRVLMQDKLNWIYSAELKLGLIITPVNLNGVIPEKAKMKKTPRRHGLAIPDIFSVSGLIFMFYIVFLLFDISCISMLIFSIISKG